MHCNTSSVRSAAIRPGDYVEHESGCWLWQGTIDPQGYGTNNRAGQTRRAHRFVYEQLVGPIPEGHHLHHRCEVRACVNPAHLEPLEPYAHQIGHWHPKSALTIEQVLEIRASDKTCEELGRIYDQHPGNIRAIKRFASWKKVGGAGRPEVYCAECGELITDGRRNRRYCSDGCQSRHNARRQWHRHQGKIAPPLEASDGLVAAVASTAGADGWTTAGEVAQAVDAASPWVGRLLMRLVKEGSLDTVRLPSGLRRYRLPVQERNAA